MNHEFINKLSDFVTATDYKRLESLAGRLVEWEQAEIASYAHAQGCGCHRCWQEHEQLSERVGQLKDAYYDEFNRVYGKYHPDQEEEYLEIIALSKLKGGQDE